MTACLSEALNSLIQSALQEMNSDPARRSLRIPVEYP